MDTDAYSPFAAQCFVWRGPGGQWTLTIVCKATFSLRPGLSPVMRESEPIFEADRCDAGGLRAPSDLAPVKEQVDVVVVGNAFAPPGRAVTSVVARVAVSTVDKSIRVVGPRTVMHDGSIRDGAPWSEIAIGYDRAAGGEGTWNPIGIAHDSVDRHGRRSLPNVEPPGWSVDAKLPPIGLGPLAADWPSRRARLSPSQDEPFSPGWHERPFPESVDVGFFQTAPADQRLEELPRDAVITLEHLHRETSRLETRLEEVRPTATVEVRGRPAREVALRADTLWIDTDRAICAVVWRGHATVASREEEGIVTVCDARDVPPEEQLQAPSVGSSSGTRGADRPVDEECDPEEVEYQHTVAVEETLAHGSLAPTIDPLPFKPPPSSRVPIAAQLPMSLPASQNPSALAPALFVPDRAASVQTSPGWAPAPSVTPPPIDDAHRSALGRAAYTGAVAASHAAAEVASRSSATSVGKSGRARAVVEAPIELVWFDPAVVPRVRADVELAVFARDIEPGPLDDEEKVRQAQARADRATLSATLARAHAVADVEGQLLASVTDDGVLEPHLCVIGGAIEWSFDDIEVLKIWTTTASALVPADKRVKEVVDAANETMATPLGGEPDVAKALVGRLREAWAKAQKSLPNDYIDKHARRLLLNQRRYDKRTFGDAEWIRATLLPDGAEAHATLGARTEAIPIYVPSRAARTLPLFVRAHGRVLGDLVPQRDETERAPVALLVSALALVVGRRT